MSKSLLCLGMGYCAREFARRMRDLGWTVAGTTRSAEKAKQLEGQGFRMVVFDGEGPLVDIDGLLAGVTHVLASIPPDDDGDPFLKLHGEDLARHAGPMDWAGYLSTTGVYGDHAGAWVDEDAPTVPSTDRGGRRVLAEGQWQALGARSGLPVHIFRLAGIYGPDGRNQIEAVRQGKARRIIKPNHFVGRVHRDDIVGILAASVAKPNPGRVYNVADNEPSPPEEVIAYAARLLGVETPPAIPFEEAELSAVARGFFAGSKRVCNARVREELDYSFKYPTYREGLQALVAAAQ
ncbi:SDR family oxidoreductase [Rhodoligotrophos defluvii]|uniref:SDR family oxidoreductase n=1 Tax=Rhodoligotrophos defluvii TaxID=2561934 RepID=UPI0010C9FA4C|nr:SDR family oxidoreductase [Rhodoligotrophos defluvii]